MRRQIEIFSAGCQICQEAIDLVNRIACGSCDVKILDMADSAISRRAQQLGIHTIPAILIDGQLADCCEGGGPDEAALRAAGIGQPPSQP